MLSATFLQKMPTLVLALVVTLFTYQMALLTWAFVAAPKHTLLWAPLAMNNDKNITEINTTQLQQQHLFGEKSSEAQALVQFNDITEITDAPKTRLKLILVGIVAASEAKYSSVIIDSKGIQNSYFIDSKIDGTNAVIAQIYPDRIIIDVKGAKQTLMLDGIDSFAQPQKNNGRRGQKSRVPYDRDVKIVNLDRQELLKNPGKLTDYIRISPVRKDGEVQGYRVKPGKNKTFFQEAGLKSGDLAVELNGIDLTDTQQAFTLMKEFPTMTDISLSVERDGQLHEIYLSIP
ncbi:MAG: type II secretion system protein GspC [Psychromonas sp.]